jgi:tryptophanyl-tRNA synthetase
MQRYQSDPAQVDAILRQGAERAAELADEVMREVRDVVGFLNVRK